MFGLDWCNGSCNPLDDPSGNAYVQNKVEDVNLDVFNLIIKKQNIFHVNVNVNLMVENEV